MFSLSGERSSRTWVACLSGVWLLLTGCLTVLAQGDVQYKSDPIAADLVDTKSKDVRKLVSDTNKMLRGSIPFTQATLDRWYGGRWLPLMTSPANIGRLADGRRQLIKDLNIAAETPEVHAHLTKLFYDFGRKVAQQAEAPGDNYHPAVRFNGVLLLGELNDQEAVLSGGDRRPPVPYRNAFGPLVIYAADEKQADAVRLAALLGVKRHVELRTMFPQVAGQLASEERETVLRNMVQLVAADQPPAGRTREGHDWMRTIAAETLGLLGTPGQNAIAVQGLTRLVGQSDADLSARCAAAKALGQIDFGTSKPNAAELVDPITRLAADCSQAELRFLGDILADEAAAAEAGGGRRDPPRNELMASEDGPNAESGSTFLDQRSIPTRRRLLSQLLAIRQGLMGPDGKSGLSAIAANEVRAPVQQIDAMIASLREPSTDIQKLNDALAQQTLDLQKLAGSTAASPPAAESAPAATTTAAAASGAAP